MTPIFILIFVLSLQLMFFANCSAPLGKPVASHLNTAESSASILVTVNCTVDLNRVGIPRIVAPQSVQASNPTQITEKSTNPANPFALEKIQLRRSTSKLVRSKAKVWKPNETSAVDVEGENPDEYVAIMSKSCIDLQRDGSQKAISSQLAIDSYKGSSDFIAEKFLWSAKDQDGDLADLMQNDPCIIGVSPNRKYKPLQAAPAFTVLNDTFRNTLLHLTTFEIEKALSLFFHTTYGFSQTPTENALVAVLDTGVFSTHPDLTNQMHRNAMGQVIGIDANTLGISGQEPSTDATDLDAPPGASHGTHVSGIIAAQANNNAGVAGIAPFGVRIVPVRVFYKETINGQEELVSDTATVVKGLVWATSQNVDVINLSLGGPAGDPAMLAALQNAVRANIFIAAAAGNDGNLLTSSVATFPAYYANTIQGMLSVGSVNSKTNARSSFSNYSNTLVEITSYGAEDEGAANGIGSTYGPSSYVRLSGTSMASPMVAGGAALAIGLYRKGIGEKPSPAQLEQLLQNSATKLSALNSFFKDGNVLNLNRLAENIYLENARQFNLCMDQTPL